MKKINEEKLVAGEITIAEYVGLNKERQYEIARKGYELMETGRLDEAETIYKGLVAADPYDSVFHSQLGAIYFRKQDYNQAFRQFDDSIRLNKANVDALAARGELLLMKQKYEQGITDLKKAVENDPNGTKQSSIRARALLLSLRDAVEKRQAEAGPGH
ncbi:MAG: tetratricopeptide repeat protein [Acidobacteriota bacterium]|nr:tetratricopeptide repeat protein [Acidobacteriota bacterium]MDH3530968.1 tetratricopeptide repeat protein [Acidobacteriota bacterium]